LFLDLSWTVTQPFRLHDIIRCSFSRTMSETWNVTCCTKNAKNIGLAPRSCLQTQKEETAYERKWETCVITDIVGGLQKNRKKRGLKSTSVDIGRSRNEREHDGSCRLVQTQYLSFSIFFSIFNFIYLFPIATQPLIAIIVSRRHKCLNNSV